MTQVTQTINELRNQGYRVFFTHYRPTKHDINQFNILKLANPDQHYTIDQVKCHKIKDLIGQEVSPKGGITVCEILKGDQKLVRSVSKCNVADNFSRSLGARISLGRALKKITLNK